MAQHQDQFGPSHMACELHAAQQVFVDKFPAHAAYKDIPNAFIEHILPGTRLSKQDNTMALGN